MEVEISVLIQQMIMFFTLIIIGFFSYKLKLLREPDLDGIGKLIIGVVLPLFIFTNIVNGATRGDLIETGPFIVCGFIMIAVRVLVGAVEAIMLGIKDPTKGVHIASAGFPNSGFMGYPLILVMYPNEAAVAIASYTIVDVFMAWTVGVLLTSPKSVQKKIDLKKIINPPMVAAVAGVVLVILGVKPSMDNMVWNTITAIGSTSKYVAMLYVGGLVGFVGITKLFERPIVFMLIPSLMISPLIVFFVLKFIGIISIQYVYILSLLAALPTAMVVTVQTKTSGSDSKYATSGLVVTTLASLVTIPIVMGFIMGV